MKKILIFIFIFISFSSASENLKINYLAPSSLIRLNSNYLQYSDLYNELALWKYPNVARELFKNREIVKNLSIHKTLRPIFMVKLNDAEKIDFNRNNASFIKKYGGFEYLENNKAMLFGDIAQTEEYLRNNNIAEIIISIADKPFIDDNDSLKMTHGRQVFLPQTDGTWIGIKGAGWLKKNKKPAARSNRYMGLATSDELLNLHNEISSAVEKSLCPKYLGNSKLNNLPDTKGGFFPFQEILKEGENETAHLIYYHALTPFRFSDLSELAKTDHNLNNTRLQIARAIKSTDKRYANVSLTEIFPNNLDMFKYALRKIGTYQAMKKNLNLGKSTLHKQDFSLAGEESDTEELQKNIITETNPEKLEQNKRDDAFVLQVVFVNTLVTLPASLGLINSEDTMELLSSFFAGFFSEIDLETADFWKNELKDPISLVKRVFSVNRDGSIDNFLSINEMAIKMKDMVMTNLAERDSKVTESFSNSH